jgi:hypothetical protein
MSHHLTRDIPGLKARNTAPNGPCGRLGADAAGETERTKSLAGLLLLSHGEKHQQSTETAKCRIPTRVVGGWRAQGRGCQNPSTKSLGIKSERRRIRRCLAAADAGAFLLAIVGAAVVPDA